MVIAARLAIENDTEPVGALLAANSLDRGGSLTGHWSKQVVSKWLARGGTVIVAYDGPVLLGALLADEKAHATAPPVRKMLETYPGGDEAYVYGPVCVAKAGRGKGVLESLYLKARDIFPGREAILFIRADNDRSLRAHRKLGMAEVGAFVLDDVRYFVLSDAARR